jgi:hypothetical protein
VFAGCAAAAAAALFLLAPYAGTVFARFEEAANGEAARNAGEMTRFAGGREQAECVPEALRRLAACGGFMCKAGTPVFAKGCGRSAAASRRTSRCAGKIYGELAQACTR